MKVKIAVDFDLAMNVISENDPAFDDEDKRDLAAHDVPVEKVRAFLAVMKEYHDLQAYFLRISEDER